MFFFFFFFFYFFIVIFFFLLFFFFFFNLFVLFFLFFFLIFFFFFDGLTGAEAWPMDRQTRRDERRKSPEKEVLTLPAPWARAAEPVRVGRDTAAPPSDPLRTTSLATRMRVTPQNEAESHPRWWRPGVTESVSLTGSWCPGCT